MKHGDFTIRPMQAGDKEAGLRLSSAAGWNQTGQDWNFLINSPSTICLAAEYDGKLVGTTIAILYGDELAWISMVLVDSEFRGRGISKLLLDRILYQLTHIKSIRLDASVLGHPIYKQYGFVDGYSILRMVSKPGLVYDMATELPEMASIADFDVKRIQEIIDLDRKTFGSPRTSLIQYLLGERSHGSRCIYRNDKINGFVLNRLGCRYHHLGPLIADQVKDAINLICTSLLNKNDIPVLMDVPEDKTALIRWLKSAGFEEQSRFIRMYKNESPTIKLTTDKTFLIAGPEFG